MPAVGQERSFEVRVTLSIPDLQPLMNHHRQQLVQQTNRRTSSNLQYMGDHRGAHIAVAQ